MEFREDFSEGVMKRFILGDNEQRMMRLLRAVNSFCTICKENRRRLHTQKKYIIEPLSFYVRKFSIPGLKLTCACSELTENGGEINLQSS